MQCLAEHGADINITNSKQHTVVEDALNRGHYEIYQYLLAVQEISKYVFYYSLFSRFPLYIVLLLLLLLLLFLLFLLVCVCVCVRACVRVCVRACVCVLFNVFYFLPKSG